MVSDGPSIVSFGSSEGESARFPTLRWDSVLALDIIIDYLSVPLLPIQITTQAWRTAVANRLGGPSDSQGFWLPQAADESTSGSGSQAIEQNLPEWAAEF